MNQSEEIEALKSLDLEERERELIRINDELDQKRKEISKRADDLLKNQQTIIQSKIDNANDDDEHSAVNIDLLQSERELQEHEENNEFKEIANTLVNHSKKLTQEYDLECLPRDNIPCKIDTNTNTNNNKNVEMKDTDTQSISSTTTETHNNSNNEKDSIDIDNEFLNHGYSTKQLSVRTQKNKNIHNSDNIIGTSLTTNQQKLSNESALKLQKVRMKAMEKNYQQLIDIKNENDKKLNICNKKLKLIEMENKKYEKKLLNFEKKNKIQYEKNCELLCKIERIERDNNYLRKELTSLQLNKTNKKEITRNNEIKLNRALEEAEKYRRLLTKYKSENSNNNQIKQNEFNLIQQENNKLKKQKIELLSAFRKQMKLIDILKKQKIHMEAAKVLQFAEDQFVKTLDIGEKLMQN